MLYASKEAAKKASELLEMAAGMLDTYIPDKATRDNVKRKLIQVQAFIEAAEKKLPREASFHKDRISKKR
jgi:hypothetical protein